MNLPNALTVARIFIVPVLVSIHSFTPEMKGVKRPWEIGILWDRDDRFAKPLLDRHVPSLSKWHHATNTRRCTGHGNGRAARPRQPARAVLRAASRPLRGT